MPLNDERKNEEKTGTQARKSLESCPHCGQPLSPWQQVLLTVDRALVCRKCWYRIILPPSEENIAENARHRSKE